jgi:hypothetical protein
MGVIAIIVVAVLAAVVVVGAGVVASVYFLIRDKKGREVDEN